MRPPTNRRESIRQFIERWHVATAILSGSMIVGLLLVVGAILYAQNMLDDYLTNVFTEALGVIGTALILDRIYRLRAVQERKAELILQMGSPDASLAIEAVRILRAKGWVEDGTLKRAKLREANLNSANLREANLTDANLWQAKLNNANLWEANLGHAYLVEADLSGAKVWQANLAGANLSDADLAHASLWAADLTHANLRGAKLVGADLQDVIFNETTILPDWSKWTPLADLSRFTDPEHPNFYTGIHPKA